MPRLSPRDLRALLDYLRTTYATLDLEEFPRQAVAGLLGVVPSAFGSYNEIDPKAAQIRYIVEPPDARVPHRELILRQCLHEHPILAHYMRTGDGSPRTISDFLTRREFHRLGLYHDVYRYTRVEHQMVFMLQGFQQRSPVTIAIALDRDGRTADFSERDRLVLNLLRPHLMGAYANAQVLSTMRAAPAVSSSSSARGRETIVLSRGTRQPISPRARRWLAHYFGAESCRGDHLPDPLQRWIRSQQASLDRGDAFPLPRAPFVTERGRARLSARLIPDSPDELLVLEEERTAADPLALERLGLTPREAQVLRWLAEGKTNSEIGIVLGTSPRTVGKHLERVYAKLGVETRTAAAVRALPVTDARYP